MGYGDGAETTELTKPDHVPADLVHTLDHWNGENFKSSPIEFWDDLRDKYRVFWSPVHGGFWCLTHYQDIHEAFQRHELFSSKYVNIPAREVDLPPISLDPPAHTKYRRFLNRPLSPVAVAELEPQVRQRAAELIDQVADSDECEFITSFAQPLPTWIFLHLLGLPASELDMFLEWNHTILHVHGDEAGQERQQRANAELAAYLKQHLDKERSNPGENLVGALLLAEMDDEPLGEKEILGFLHLLFMAGLDTVTSALGWMWQFLAENPGHRQQILDDKSIIPKAIEEMLRYQSFVEVSRTVTKDIEFAGVQMKEGDRIMLPTSTAGRDEEQFADALRVDFNREPNRHLAFAAGPHRCVGSHLARAEMVAAVEEWHARIPHYRITPGKSPVAHGGAVVGLDVLPLTFMAD